MDFLIFQKYRELHRFEDALKAFREAERVQPGHRNALFNQGIVLYYDLKRKDEAEAAWRRLLAADPNAHAPDGTPVSVLKQKLRQKSLRRQAACR